MPLRARPPRRAHALRGVLSLAAAAALTLGAATPQSALTAAQALHGVNTSSATTAQTAKNADLSPKLTLAPTRAVLLSSNESMDFDFRVFNPGDTELSAGRVTLLLDPDRITNAALLDADGAKVDEGAAAALPLVEAETPAIPAGEERIITLSVLRDEWPLTTASDAGAYLAFARLELSDSQDSLATDAPIVWRGAGGLTSVQLTTIVPVALPESIPSLPRRGQLDELFGPGSSLDAMLTLAEERGATLAVDPRVVAGVRVYGEGASADSRRFIDRLVSTTAPSFALQFADADPAAQAALGFSRLLAPDGLSFASRYGTFPDPALAQDGTDDPAEPHTSAENPPDRVDATGTPGIAELTTWQTSLSGTAWPAAASVNGEVLDLLAINGYTRVLATGDNVSIAGGGARGTAGEIEFLVSDTALDSAARAALSAESETEHQSAVALTSALLVLRAQAGVPGAVLALDRQEVAESSYSAALLETILALPWVTPTSPEELPEAAATLRPAAEAADATRIGALAEAVAREPEVRDYSRVLVDPENLIDLQRVRLLQLLSARYTAPGGGFSDAADRSLTRDANTLQGIQVVTSTHTQLIGTSSRVPVQLRNTLPFDALLTAEVVPTSAALIVAEPLVEPKLIPGESSANMLVPVRSRVSSGESGLSVAVSAASGGPVVTEGRLDISIRSSWETLALSVLGALTVGFFGFGIWRSVKHRRVNRAEPGADAPGIAEP